MGDGEQVRDLMVATVEHRFGPVNRLAEPIEWLTDNGSPCVAGDTRRQGPVRHSGRDNSRTAATAWLDTMPIDA